MKRESAVQTLIWMAIGVAAFVFLKWRNDDIEADAFRLNHSLPDPVPSLQNGHGLPRPFERAKVPLKIPLSLPLITGGKSEHAAPPTKLRAERGERVHVSVTAYCVLGNTRTGTVARDGVVAADPRVFALNSEIDLSVAGRPAKRYRVEDTGLLIKGRTIDIWLPDCSEALNFGRKQGIATLATKIRR